MGKILGSWSGMKKYLEQEMTVPSLQGRVKYNCTAYPGMDGSHLFEVYVDGKLIKRFSLETVNTYFIEMGYAEKPSPMTVREYWSGFMELLEEYPPESRTEYTDDEFCAALKKYRCSDILESINSDDPIVVMFSLLDRRVGKRTLQSIAEEMGSRPDWVRYFYELRLGG